LDIAVVVVIDRPGDLHLGCDPDTFNEENKLVGEDDPGE
jgi:hypothetical protein